MSLIETGTYYKKSKIAEIEMLRPEKCSFCTLLVLTGRKKRHFWGDQEPHHALCFSTGFLTDKEDEISRRKLMEKEKS